MKIIKHITNSNKSSQIEATASAKIAEFVDANYCDKRQDTSTIKVSSRLTGLKSSDSHAEFIKALANEKRSESNGSFSIKLPAATLKERGEEITKALSQLHGHIDYIIDEGLNMLSEEEKQKGKLVAKQNYLRVSMLNLMGDVINGRELVESCLMEKGEVYIPSSAQLELHIVGGSQSFEEQGDRAGWRDDSYTFSDGSVARCWRRNLDLYGRKRVPLVEEKQIEWAIDQVFDLSKSFEETFGKIEITSVEDIVSTFCAWTDTLEHKDFVPVRNALSEEEKHSLDSKAALYVKDILK